MTNVYFGDCQVGWLSGQFRYKQEWLDWEGAFPVSASIPLRNDNLRLFRADPEAIESLRKSKETQPTEVSNHRQEVSPGVAIDLYVRESDLDRLAGERGLLPVQDLARANVFLRVVDALPSPSILRLAADLLDYNNPRTDDQAEALIREATGKVVE